MIEYVCGNEPPHIRDELEPVVIDQCSRDNGIITARSS